MLHPNDRDYNGLVAAFTNNTLTHGKRFQDEVDNQGRHKPAKHDENAYREVGWLPGGKAGSLFDQVGRIAANVRGGFFSASGLVVPSFACCFATSRQMRALL